MDPVEKAKRFVEAHAKLKEIAEYLQIQDAQHLSDGGAGSGGMQLSGVYEEYMRLSGERSNLVKELKAIRAEMGGDALLEELAKLPGADLAKAYVEEVIAAEQRIPVESTREIKPPKKRFKFF